MSSCDLMYLSAAHKLTNSREDKTQDIEAVSELFCTILVLLRHTPLIANGPFGCGLNSTWLFVNVE